jgi:soluble lytic murein transglycosylase-like protein
MHGRSQKAFCLVGAIALVAVMALPCFADEMAVLKNGFSIRHQRHEVLANVTRLYTSADRSSFVDVPTSDVDHFEPAPDLPVPAPDAATPAAANSAHLSRDSHNLGANVRSPAAFSSAKPDLSQVVNEVSGRYRLDPDLVNSVIKAESGFNVRAVSPKGAQGLMQLMPGTAMQLGVPNAFDAQANVDGGTKYLRELLERYNFDLVKALAAYNAGPHRVEQFGGVPPYYETKAYIARIVRDFNKKKIAQQRAAAATAHKDSGKTATVKTAVPKKASPAMEAKAGVTGQ